MNYKYLGKEVSPDDYYKHYANDYVNPQQDAVETMIKSLSMHIPNPIIDIGCGAGLASLVLKRLGHSQCIGVDRSKEMIERYTQETKFPGYVGNFWDPMPKGKSAIIVHALHLCPPSRTWEFEWRMREAGVENLLIISPLKRAVERLTFELLDCLIAQSGPHNKTVWGWRFKVQ